jgi:hypothetical protein
MKQREIKRIKVRKSQKPSHLAYATFIDFDLRPFWPSP